MAAKIGIIGHGGQGKILEQMILQNNEDALLLQAYKDTGLTPEEIKELERKYLDDEHEYCGEYGTEDCQFQYRLEALQKEINTYKDAEEQGLLIKLPCPEGAPVWRIIPNPEWAGNRIETWKNKLPKKIICESTFVFNDISRIGKTVFLTREAAEEALQGGVAE
jgi:hypothetical protein